MNKIIRAIANFLLVSLLTVSCFTGVFATGFVGAFLVESAITSVIKEKHKIEIRINE